MSNRPNPKPSSSQRVSQARRADQGPNRWIVVAVVAVVLILALVVAVVVGGSTGQQAGDGLVYGTVTVTGADLPAAPDGLGRSANVVDPAVGQSVPEIVGQTFDGAPVTIPAAGTPKVVMFLAHWCPHCQKEVPLLTDHLAAAGLPPGVDLYAVSTSADDRADNFPPAAWLRDAKWPVTTVADDQAGRAAQAYGIGGFPFFVAVDSAGKVVERTSGELTVEQFDALVARARGTTPVSG